MGLNLAEKLTISLLCDISKKLDAEHEINPDFVKKAIASDHEWALAWEYPGLIRNDDAATPPEVQETADILDMWSVLEHAYANLSETQKAEVEQLAAPLGKQVYFQGFDGNNERHYGLARFIVNDLKRYDEFKGRDLNSHAPSIDRYRRMLGVYNKIMEDRYDVELSPQEITEILKVQRA